MELSNLSEDIQLLLVEDEPIDREKLKRLFNRINSESESFKIKDHEAATISDALSLLNNQKIDLVFLDLGLSDASGLSGIEDILKEWGSKIPIVILSGNEAEKTALEAIRLGAQDYIIKDDISISIIERTLKYSLERHNLTKEIEEVRLEKAKLLKLATLGELSTTIAHEINTPLSVILTGSDRIRRKAENGEGLSCEELKKLSTTFLEVTNHIIKVLKGLKSYSKNSGELVKEEFSLSSVIDKSLQFCSSRFQTTDVLLDIEKVPEVTLLGQDFQITQVIVNLLNNAYEAVQDTKGSWVKVYFQEENGDQIIFIENSGRIKSEEVKRKIFDPFYTTKKSQGTGLGLSISESIMRDHGGDLEYFDGEESTTFKVSLPIGIGR